MAVNIVCVLVKVITGQRKRRKEEKDLCEQGGPLCVCVRVSQLRERSPHKKIEKEEDESTGILKVQGRSPRDRQLWVSFQRR